jgi:tetratricopeptide (TPR) repeat protein
VLIAKRLTAILAATCLSILICGCNSGNQEVSGEIAPPIKTGAPTTGEAPKAAPTVLTVGAATTPYEKAKKAYEAAKSDEKLKQTYIDATNSLADANLYADELPPRVKYPAALKYFREVLKVDPKNAKALENEKLIVDIYKSMGKAVPGEGK